MKRARKDRQVLQGIMLYLYPAGLTRRSLPNSCKAASVSKSSSKRTRKDLKLRSIASLHIPKWCVCAGSDEEQAAWVTGPAAYVPSVRQAMVDVPGEATPSYC